MLHGLGKELRVAGCDTVILGDDEPHTNAIRYARAEDRIILSRGAPYNLLRSHTVEGRCWQPPLNLPAKKQCEVVLNHFNVNVLPEDIFSRCTLCNGNDYAIVNASDMRVLWCKINNHSLKEYEPDLINYQLELIDIDRMTLYDADVPLDLTGLTLRNYRSYDEFCVCRKCGKVYWQGTHWRRRVNRDVKEKEFKQEKEEDNNSDDGIVFYDAESTL